MQYLDLAPHPRAELTLRGLIIGVVITLVFTAANVFFGLKAGLTFATSIPAAVISMAILRAMKNATIQENNIVQTVASAAGTLSSIIFVLPGLIIVGWWTGFPFWMSFGICAAGGILGVMYTIPLRRALVTDSDLPYPEGVACAEVLKVGSGEVVNASDSAAVEGGSSGLRLWLSVRSSRRCSTSSWETKILPATSHSIFVSAIAVLPAATISACPSRCSQSAIWSVCG